MSKTNNNPFDINILSKSNGQFIHYLLKSFKKIKLNEKFLNVDDIQIWR